MKRIRKSKSSIFAHKKVWFIGGGLVLAALLVGGFVAWSNYAWGDYEKTYTAWHQELGAKNSTAFGLPASNSSEKTKKINALKSVYVVADKGRANCDRYGWIHWQQFIGAVKFKLDGCEEEVKRAQSFVSDLRVVVDHVDAEAKIASTLKKVGVAKEVDEVSLKTTSAQWTKVVSELQTQKLPKSLAATQKLAVEKAKAIEAAWRALATASEAKDRDKYEATLGQLTTAYGELEKVGLQGSASLQPLLDSLQKTYGQAFGEHK
jgi:hypothetical protein